MKKATTESFIASAVLTHGDKYDYSITEYKNARTKVEVVCKLHGSFMQSPQLHINGSNCPKCVGLKKSTTEEFIAKAELVHNNFYDYSRSAYKNNKTKLTIICPEHGEFLQNPNNHLSGCGCGLCGNNVILDLKHFLTKSKSLHGDTYTYGKAVYKGVDHLITITCREHGDFDQVAAIHMKGSCCPKCKPNYKLTTATFIERANEVHHNKYRYDDAVYLRSHGKVIITCPDHGDFIQTASLHLGGGGCPDCGGTKGHTTETFIKKATLVHGDKYDYSKTSYVNAKTNVVIGCPTHGDFLQLAQSHINQAAGCPKCSHTISKAEQYLADMLTSKGLSLIQSDRKILNGLELDIVIPEKKIAIEFNGVYWHSEANGKDKSYHLNKTTLANAAGYRLIHIWEDDFTEDSEREINFILNACGKVETKSVYARKTIIKEIPTSVSSPFLTKYHVQGSVISSVRLGTFIGEDLVAVTLFTKRKYGYELVRHATSLKVIGGLGKAVKHFHRLFGEEIHSFCDLSRHDGRSYDLAGFVKSGSLNPDYKYVVDGKREHKFGFRLASIKTKFPEFYSPEKSERQMMEDAGIPRVWDCGKTRYIFK